MVLRKFVVTGANKGIGLAIVRLLAQTQPQAIVYLTARNAERGTAALDELKRGMEKTVADRLRFHQLDITDK